MQIKRKSPEEVDINVGSFADIAFLLIIFFILASTFLKPTGRELDIPKSTKDPEQQEQEQLRVVLTPGQIRYGKTGKIIDIDAFREVLHRQEFAKKAKDERIVVVQSNPKVPYTEWFQVVMAISSEGGVLGLIEEQKNNGSPSAGAD